MNALVIAATVNDGRVHIVDEAFYRTRVERAAKKWGEGCALTIRIEPEADAKTYGQLKYFHGYVLQPLIEYTGDYDWKLYLKFMFLPEGKTSLSQLNYDEMRAFTEQAEAYARTECPEAYERYGREWIG